MAKRIITKIGDIFCVEIDGKYKCYFQYICSDISQLNSSVIRMFRTRYPLDYMPDINNIVKDEVQFYAHTILRPGIADGIWIKVGKSNDIGNDTYKTILFGYCNSNIFINTELHIVNPLENWMIWHIDEPLQRVRLLSPQQKEELTDGSVVPYSYILDRIKYGYYKNTNPMYDVIKRRPLPDVDSYCRREVDGVTIYYHFHGADLVQEMFVDGETVYRLSDQEPISPRYSLDAIKFWDINWRHQDFVTEEEFNHAWSDK